MNNCDQALMKRIATILFLSLVSLGFSSPMDADYHLRSGYFQKQIDLFLTAIIPSLEQSAGLSGKSFQWTGRLARFQSAAPVFEAQQDLSAAAIGNYDLETIPAGSFIIDMGVVPQTVNNGLKPYGLVFELMDVHKVPIKWVINPNKLKDGVDITHNGISYKGGPFIILAGYRSAAVNACISSWQAKGVVGQTTVSDFQAPVYTTLSFGMRWTLDLKNGAIAKEYLVRAGIPSYAYNFLNPEQLNCCTDVFVMPHAEPVWSTHKRLLYWNASQTNGGCSGIIWVGCKAVSEVENIQNPANAAERLNFLMKDPVLPGQKPAIYADQHDDGSLPPPYKYNFPTHPIMQFIGVVDGSSENGAEQVYLPTVGWRPTTMVGVYDHDHKQVPNPSPGPAAKIAFGNAFGDPTRGMVMYSAGHRHDKDSKPANIAAQRSFMNFSLLAIGGKTIQVSANIPSMVESGTPTVFTATATRGSGNYSYEWVSECGGTFSNNASSSPTFTPPSVIVPTSCKITVEVTDDCGTRVAFYSQLITIVPTPLPPVAVDDYASTSPGVPVIINALQNDSDPNFDPLTLTLIGNPVTSNGTFVRNANQTVTYTPYYYFAGVDHIDYKICDTTSVSDGGPLCDTARIFVAVTWESPNGCYPNQYWGISSNAYATSASVVSNTASNVNNATGAPNGSFASVQNGGHIQVNLSDVVEQGDTIFLTITGDKKTSSANITTSYDGTSFGNSISWSSSAPTDPSSNPNFWETIPIVVQNANGVRHIRIQRSSNNVYVDAAMYRVYDCVSAVPIAANDYATTYEDIPVTYPVLINDTDPQGLVLTVSIVEQSSNGKGIVGSNNFITYFPDRDFDGIDTITYKACNTNNLCDTALYIITVLPDWCAPGYFMTPADTLIKNASAVNTENMIGNPTQALGVPTLVNNNNAYYAKIDNDGDYLVLDLTDTVQINDTIRLYIGSDDGNASQLKVHGVLSSANHANGTGYFDLETYSTNKDLNKASPTQDTVFYIPTSGKVRYLRFTRVTGAGKPCVNGVSFRKINFVCTPFPVMNAANDFEATTKGSPVVVYILNNDEGGEAPLNPASVTTAGLTQPKHGQITYFNTSSGAITYTPEPHFAGRDTFQYQVCNTQNTCDVAQVVIDVACLNPGNGNLIEGEVFVDVDGDNFYDVDESGLENIKISLYKDVNSNGVIDAGDTFVDTTRTDTDGQYIFNVTLPPASNGSISNRINASANDAEESLVCSGCSTYQGYVYRISSDLDFNSDAAYNGSSQLVGMRFTSLSIPKGATITSATVKFTAYPDASPNTPATSVAIQGEDIGNAPTIGTAYYGLSSRTKTTASVAWNSIPYWYLNVEYTSPDISPVIQEIVNRQDWSSGNALLLLVSGTGFRQAFAYDGSPSKAPLLSIEYSVSGSAQFISRIEQSTLPANSTLINGNSEVAYLSGPGVSDCNNNFEVAINNPPVAMPDTTICEYGTSVEIPVSDNDTEPDGDNLSFTVLNQPSYGSLVNNEDGTMLYQHTNLSFTGTDYFSYIICDDGIPVLCDTTHVIVEIIQFINNPPVAVNDYDTTVINQDAAVWVDKNDYDPENDSLTVFLDNGLLQPSNGTLILAEYNQVIYYPDLNFTGVDSFEYYICDDDENSLCDTAKVFIWIMNQPPVAETDHATTYIDHAIPITILINDFEPDDGVVVLESIGTNGTNTMTTRGGSITINDNGSPADPMDDFVNYSPPASYIGKDTCYYLVRDNQQPMLMDSALVIVTITPPIDLELDKSISPPAVNLGSNVTFTLTLENKGPGNATGVRVRDLLPSGLTYVSDNGNGQYDKNTGVWNVGTINALQTKTLQIVTTVTNFHTAFNITQVIAANEKDIDSTPNNDDGDQSEDDEDNAVPVRANATLSLVPCTEPTMSGGGLVTSYNGQTNILSVVGLLTSIDTVNLNPENLISYEQGKLIVKDPKSIAFADPVNIIDGNLNLQAVVLENGLLSSGTFWITGEALGASDTLLRGDIIEFGYDAMNGNPFEFRSLLSGGNLATKYGNIGDSIVILISNIAGFTNQWTDSWSGGSECVAAVAPNHCQISGEIRYDEDMDGDPNDPEQGLPSVTIQLYHDTGCDGSPNTLYRSLQSRPDGTFDFLGVPPGCYIVVEVDPLNHTSTFDSQNPNNNAVAVLMNDDPKAASTGHLFLDAFDCIFISPGFEDDLTGWTTTGTVSITNQSNSGSKAARLDSDNATLSQSRAVAPGQLITISFYGKIIGSPSNASVSLIWKNAINETISDVVLPVYSTDFQSYELIGTAPAGSASVEIRATKSGGTEHNLVVDDFCLIFGGDLIDEPFDLSCGCSENYLPNNGFEFFDASLSFPYTISGSPVAALDNQDNSLTLPWSPDLMSDYMFLIKDTADVVNNPEGDYFIWLPSAGDSYQSNVHFSKNLNLEDGQEYELCFYAASWNAALDAGLPTGGAVTQNSGTLELEFNFVSDGLQPVAGFALPASTTWANLSWKKHSYRFTYSELNPVKSLLFTNSRSSSGIAIDAVSLTKVNCDANEANLCPTGSLRVERWTGITGNTLDALKTDPDFPFNPDTSAAITSFQGPANWGENFGTKVSGYLHPAETGVYYFTVTGDENTELYLSTDYSSANKVLIASVPGSTNIAEYTKYPEQLSATINLTAGEAYYIELLQKEGTGADHFQVYWQTPSNVTRTIIAGQYLSPVCSDEICDNGLDDDLDGLTDCEDPDCEQLSLSMTMTVVSCGSSPSDGSIDLTSTGEQPLSFVWNDMTPTAHYTFENTTDDLSGNGNHLNGGLGAAIYASNSFKEGNKSLYLDGNTFLRYSIDGLFMEVSFTKLTFAAWIKPNNLTGIQTIYKEGSITNGISLRLNGNQLQGAVRDAGIQVNAGALTFPNDGQWHHVALVFNNGVLTIYLDGQPGTSGTAPYSIIGNHNVNGGLGYRETSDAFENGNGGFFAGYMDDARYFFDKALTNSQIADLYRNDGDRTLIPEGFYIVTMSNTNNCSVTDSIDVPAGVDLNDPGTIAGNESVCVGADPGPITSTTPPSGGSLGVFVYRWEMSTNGGTNWTVIPGATQIEYDPGTITVTTIYRRLVKRSVCLDWHYSNIITKTVIQNITDPGEINGNEEVCGSFDPFEITSLMQPSGGSGGTIQYQWQYSMDGSTWMDILTGLGVTFDPGTITVATYYRRGARRSPCSEWVYTDPILKRVVTNYTSAGFISGDEAVCGSYDPTAIISVTAPSGGSGGSLFYQWQSSTDDGSNWSNISGAITATYDPGYITQTTMYRRRARRSPCTAWLNSNTVTKTVNLYPEAIITSSENGTLCEPTEYAFDATDQGGNSNYLWEFGNYASLPTANGKGPHTISYNVPDNDSLTSVIIQLTVTRNSCVTISTDTIQIRPIINITNVTSADPTDCAVPNGSIQITATYPEGTTVEASVDAGSTWNAPGQLNFTGLGAGIYSIRIRYSNDECQISGTSLTLDDPVQPEAIILGSDADICENELIILEAQQGAGNSTYTWEFDDGATPTDTASGIGPHYLTYSSGGMKTVKLTVVRNNCTNTDEITFSVVSNFTDGGSIIGNETLCSANDPDIIETAGAPYGGYGGSTLYQWEKRDDNGIGGWNSWQDIPGATNSKYNPGLIFVNTQYRRKARRSPCVDWIPSNEVTKKLNLLPFLVNDIYDPACPGQLYFDNLSENDQILINPEYSIVTPPANGSVDLDVDGEFVYVPNTSYCGIETFYYQVCNDSSLCCDTARVDINMNDVNTPDLFNIPDDVTIHCDELIPLPPFVLAVENCLTVSLGLDEISTQGIDNCSLYDFKLTRTWTAVDYCGNSNTASQLITIEDNTAPDIYRVYTLPNGKKMVAGVMENVTGRWKLIRFPIQFPTKPIVFAQVVSQNEFTPVTVRIRNISTTQFEMFVQEEDGEDKNHLEEDVAWIAIEEGKNNQMMRWEVGKKTVLNGTSSILYQQAYNNIPAFIGTIQSFNEPDPATLRFRNETTGGININIQEELSQDWDTTHLSELVGYMAIEHTGNFKLSTGEVIGEVGMATPNNEWITINLENKYKNPVVVSPSFSMNDGMPSVVRVRNVDSTSFEIRVDEWGYQDGLHGNEKIYYMVVEGSVPLDTVVECSSIPSPPALRSQIVGMDNCDNTLDIVYTELPRTSNCAPNNIITRIWSVTDECGNHFSISQKLIVQDTTPPTFTAPADVPVGCSEDFDNLSITGDVFDEADNCSSGLQAIYNDLFENTFSCDTVYTVQRLWKVTDDCGNMTTKIQNLYIQNIGVTLLLKAKLQGALYGSNNGLMRDDLRALGLIPLQEPYTNLPHFQHIGEGGGETISPAVLEVTGPNAVVDWVFIEIRDAIKRDSIVQTRSALVLRNGQVVDTDGYSGVRFNSLRGGSYNVAVRHRNHLGAMTGITSVLTPSMPTFVDMNDTTANTYGHYAQFKDRSGGKALWSGDFNGDRSVIYQGPKNDVIQLFVDILTDEENTNNYPNFIRIAYDLEDFDLDGKIIYQGPNNDRAKLLFNVVLLSGENVYLIPNFIVSEKIPR